MDFAFRSWPGRASRACDLIADRGFKVFRPLTRIRVKRRCPRGWRTVWTTHDYFKDWFFVTCHAHEVHIIKGIPFVADFARTGEMPIAISSEFMTALKSSANKDGIITVSDETLRRRFETNAAVIFAENTMFAGLCGTVLKDSGGARVRVLLKTDGGKCIKTDAPAETLITA